MNEPLAVLLELIGHVVERLDRSGHFVASPALSPVFQPARPVSTSKIGERRGELLYGLADAVSDQHQRQQRDEPRRAEQHEQRERETSAQVARIDRGHEPPRFPNLG